MNTSRSGLSVVAVIVGLVVVVALVVGGLYAFTDVFRAKMQGAWKNFAEWTPDNIAKDPQGYLTFCEEKTKAALQKLEGSRIGIAQAKDRYESKREDAKKILDTGTKALDGLKTAYRKAEEANSWPMKWELLKDDVRTLDREQARKQIVAFDKQVRAKTTTIQGYNKTLTQLEIQSGKVQEAKDKAKEQLDAIASSREELKAKAITDDLKKQLVDMKSILQTGVVGIAESEEKSLMSIEDVAAKTESTVSDEDFSKIMGK
jgi:hypothetical protein